MAARSNSRRSGALRCNDAVQHSSGVKCDGRHMIHPSLPLSQCLTLDGEPVALSRLSTCLPHEERHNFYDSFHKALRLGHCRMLAALAPRISPTLRGAAH